jgi:hypothetical protein
MVADWSLGEGARSKGAGSQKKGSVVARSETAEMSWKCIRPQTRRSYRAAAGTVLAITRAAAGSYPPDPMPGDFKSLYSLDLRKAIY